ncbi:HAD family hydrolase [Hyphococcus lacteus]|uniref:HAD family hydrolase n=1 Tax=Hyphococcus lacteus TaxID=3143536 RepID=A0ABV3Z418_9PROT
MTTLEVLAFDADDTLWQNERFFRLTETAFADLLSDYADPAHLTERLLETERRNLARYGFGIKGFTLSMIETALEITEGKAPASVIQTILDKGHEMLEHPVELLPHVAETIQSLKGDFRLMVITKGDLFDQERKIALSGLADHFDGIEIVSDKNPETYRNVFSRHGVTAENAMMVGNSLKSDVLPVLDLGGWGVHVPHSQTWVFEHADPPQSHPRFREIDHLGGLQGVLKSLG